MSFRHDSRGIDVEKKFSLLPEGQYLFKIFDATEKTSSSGNPMIQIKCSVVNEPIYADMEVWHWVVFIPKGEKGDWMSVHFRKCIGVPYGGDDEVNADDWVGKRFVGRIKHEPYNGKMSHKIAEVLQEPEGGFVKAPDNDVPF